MNGDRSIQSRESIACQRATWTRISTQRGNNKNEFEGFLWFIQLNYKCFLCPFQLQDPVGSLSVRGSMLCFDQFQ